MPTKRRKIAPRPIRHATATPPGAAWWLEHGQSLSIAEAAALGLDAAAAWQVSFLHYDRKLVATTTFWTRADCRAAGHGPAIDEHIQRGACPADGWRDPPNAEVLPFGARG